MNHDVQFKTPNLNKNSILLFSLAILLGGCGYTTHSTLPVEFKTIAVSNFINKIEIQTTNLEYKTYYPGLETKITNAIIDRFIYDGNLRITKEEDANLILSGELLDYLRQPLRYSESDDVEEYRISLYVNIVLKDNEGNVIWSKNNFVGETTYNTRGALAKTENTALDEAVADLARRIVNLTVEAW